MRFIIGIILTISLWGTSYAGMVSVAKPTATLKDFPSESSLYANLYVPRYYPLDVIEAKDNYYKVMDYSGNIGWIHKDDVDETNSVVVKVSSANVRSGAGLENEVIFIANQGVAFKVLNANDNWLEVAHEKGKKGWIHKNIVWGYKLNPISISKK